jgi:hypothetical protein
MVTKKEGKNNLLSVQSVFVLFIGHFKVLIETITTG